MLKFQVSFLPSNFLSACVSKLPHSGRPGPGNLSRVPSSHSWGRGMLKCPTASAHTSSNSWFLLSWGRATSSEKTGETHAWNAGTAVGFSHRKRTAKCCPPGRSVLTRFLLSRREVRAGAGAAGGSGRRGRERCVGNRPHSQLSWSDTRRAFELFGAAYSVKLVASAPFFI